MFANDNKRVNKASTMYLVSAVFIAVSFVALIPPLALFHAAQIAATSKLRKAIFLLAIVSLVLLILGSVFLNPAFLLGGISGFFWFPLFSIVLHQRLSCKPIFLTLFLLSIPTLFLFFTAFFFPGINEFNSFFESFNSQLAIQAKSLNAGNDQIINSLLSFSNTPEFSLFRSFAQLSAWQRVSWFVYGDGIFWLISAIGIGLSNLLFLDFAFEQIEKLKAIASFVQENETRFAKNLKFMLAGLQFNVGLSTAGKFLPRVISVKPYNPDENSTWYSWFLRASPRKNFSRLLDFCFLFEFPAQNWRLRSVRIFFPAVIVSIFFLASVSLGFGGSKEIIQISNGAWGPLLALFGVVAVTVLGVLAMQGVVVILDRLTPMFLIGLFLGAIIILFSFSVNIMFVLATFCVIGILDYAYDFCGKLAYDAKPV